MKYTRVFLYTCWLILVLYGCLSAPKGKPLKSPLDIQVLKTGNQSFPAPDTWTATWISSRDLLENMFSRFSAHRIGSPLKEPPSVDFERFGILAVEMGQQSSAGYGFNTRNINAFVENNTATIRLEYYQPRPGTVTAQIITAPWLLIKIPLGDYDRILVIDSDGRVLTRAEISSNP